MLSIDESKSNQDEKDLDLVREEAIITTVMVIIIIISITDGRGRGRLWEKNPTFNRNRQNEIRLEIHLVIRSTQNGNDYIHKLLFF